MPRFEAGASYQPDTSHIHTDGHHEGVIEDLRSQEIHAIEAWLREGKITGTSRLEGGCNEVQLVQFADGNRAIFKPANGAVDAARGDIMPETYHQREVSAYLVDRALGFNIVPPTSIRMIDGRVGSIQQFVPDSQPFALEQSMAIPDDELVKLWIFDIIVRNSDRHYGNILIKDNHVVAIDHGLSFGHAELRPAYEYYGKPMDEHSVANLGALLASEEQTQHLLDELVQYLPLDQAYECIDRIEKIYNLVTHQGCILEDDFPFDDISPFYTSPGSESA